MHDTGQVISDRVQVHRVFQPGRERSHGLVGVIAGPVEPAVHGPLHPAAQRVEQRRRRQSRGGHRHRGVDLEHLGGQQHQARVDADQQAGDDRVGQGPGDDPVDVVQPVLQDRHADGHRQRGDTQPGEAARRTPPKAWGRSPTSWSRARNRQMMLTVAPLASHFSCWRRSPVARRQLSAWRAMKASDSASSTKMSRPWTALNQPAGTSRAVRPPLLSTRTGCAAQGAAHRCAGRGEQRREPHAIGPQRTAPEPRGQPAVREQQDRDREQHQAGAPELVQR